MERIDPIIQPVPAAGTDPGYIAGFMAPRLAEEADDAAKDVPQEAADEATEEAEAKADEKAGEKADDEAKGEDGADGAVSFAKDDASDDEGDTGAADTDDGPVFEVSDRRASMTADRTGVRFQLDEAEADFGWDEIGAVEVETPRFGRRFTVTLHTTGRRHYQSDVDAPSRSSLKEWTAELDAVLDAYFEEA
ncbi:hypothetical protein [Streptomyces sp. NPDC050428]|uniref:hypothetical protein n=1 Tax=Streptomyces sp. NPDC050428 TaxID=3155757 RepID=UPI003420E4EB